MVKSKDSRLGEAEEALKESEKKYRTLFESSRDAIMMLAPPTWAFTSGNPSTINMFNAKDEKDFTSKGPWEVSPEYQPDGQLSSEKAKKMIDKAMKQGSNFFEWQHKRINGETFPATVLLTKINLEGKELLQATVRDITEQKKAEVKLRANEEQFRKIFEYSNDAIFIIDPEKDKIINANRKASKMLGYSHTELLSLPVSAIHPKEMLKLKAFAKSVFKEGSGWTNELTCLTKKGNCLPSEISASVILLNQRPHMLALVRDVTERKKVEQQLLSSKAKLQERAAELEELNLELKDKNINLEKFKKLTVGRELRMEEIENENERLKEEIEKLKKGRNK